MTDKIGQLLEEYEKYKELFEMEQLVEVENKIIIILDELFLMKNDFSKD